MKYHISKDGKMRPCRSKGPCPLGANFETKELADNYISQKNLEVEKYEKLSSEAREYSREEAVERGKYVNETVMSYISNQKETSFTELDKRTGEYNKERQKLHEDILESFEKKFSKAKKNKDVIFSAGLPGAGKTTILKGLPNVNLEDYVVVSSDDFKEEFAERDLIPNIPGLSQMEASTLVHTESSYLADKFLANMSSQGYNIIYDFTCKNTKTTSVRMNVLKDEGYKEENMQFVFVDISLDVAQERAIARYEYGLNGLVKGENNIGGRYLPPAVLSQCESKTGKFSSVNAESLIEIYDNNQSEGMPKPIVYDNSVDIKDDPNFEPEEIEFDEFRKPQKSNK